MPDIWVIFQWRYLSLGCQIHAGWEKSRLSKYITMSQKLYKIVFVKSEEEVLCILSDRDIADDLE